jgi:hypothetical protein
MGGTNGRSPAKTRINGADARIYFSYFRLN